MINSKRTAVVPPILVTFASGPTFQPSGRIHLVLLAKYAARSELPRRNWHFNLYSMTGAQYEAELFTWDLARRGNTIARIGRLRRENARSGLRAWNKFERPAFARVAMTTGPSKSAKHPSPVGVEWVGWRM